MWRWMDGGWYGGGFAMMFMMIIFWVLIIAGGVFLFRTLTKSTRFHPEIPSNTALDILKVRYAKGEISKEEFEQMKKDIQ